MRYKMNLIGLYLRNSSNVLTVSVARRSFSSFSCHRTPLQTTVNAHEQFPLSSDFNQETETKVLKIAIIGLPNAGKSTLINQLIGRKLCPISCKTHTTKLAAKFIQTEGLTQLIYLDTPGLVTEAEFERFRLSESFRSAAVHALKEADVIGVVHDASNPAKRLHFDPVLMHLLQTFQSKKSFLVLNKTDLVKKKRFLLSLTSTLTKDQENVVKPKRTSTNELKGGTWPFFKETFYVSAQTGDGVGDIKAYLMMQAVPRPWPFSVETVTDRPLEKLIVESLHASMLDALPQEIPRLLKIYLLNMECSDEGAYYATMNVVAKRERHIRMILGTDGLTLKKICTIAETNLASAFGKPIFLKVAVISEEKKD